MFSNEKSYINFTTNVDYAVRTIRLWNGKT